MAPSPLSINVVSRAHVVVCHACSATARRVADACPSCGTALADAGFAIVAADRAAGWPRLGRLQLRRTTAA